MDSILPFKKQILEYLECQKNLETEDIDRNRQLPYEEKVDKGLLIPNAEIIAVSVAVSGYRYLLKTDVDNSKIRVGDQVQVLYGLDTWNAKVIDFGIETISIETSVLFKINDKVSLEIVECVFLDPIINAVERLDDGKPGAYFLKVLFGIERPYMGGKTPVIDDDSLKELTQRMNKEQLSITRDILYKPSVYCVQGPPGTGKTAVLSTLAYAYSIAGNEVLVLSNTHQAVNNALNKIAALSDKIATFKIGKMVKSDGLIEKVHIAESFKDYLESRKNKKKRQVLGSADVIGMTLHSAAINLGLRVSGVLPRIVLVDEAGQIPMPYASLIGIFGSGTIVFIGDDNQMPPIYHPNLCSHSFSKSIFEFLCETHPELRHTLTTTYRMNEDITRFVSRNFYEIHNDGQRIISSEFSKQRKLVYDSIPSIFLKDISKKTEISEIFESEQSIFLLDVSPRTIDGSELFHDYNPYEAQFSYEIITVAKRLGMATDDIAIITPYRKQVKLIRSLFSSSECNPGEIPLINTVECLQGQDVEMIVISFSASDVDYIKSQLDFIMNPNRLNVMISRAKTKVVLLMSWWLKNWFQAHYIN